MHVTHLLQRCHTTLRHPHPRQVERLQANVEQAAARSAALEALVEQQRVQLEAARRQLADKEAAAQQVGRNNTTV